MGFTKRELIEFLDGLVELASEENKVKAVLAKEKFISDFENTYGYEKEVITEVSKLPPHYIAAMPDSVQEEIKQKVIAALTEHGECTPENVDRAMSSKIYDLEDLIDIREYVERMEAEQKKKAEQKRSVMKEKLFEVKAEIKAKAGGIVTAAKQKGKAALNKVAEFLGIKKKLEGIRQNVQESIADVDKSIGKIDAFGTGMREAGQKIANTFRTFADKPEKEYGEKKFSKTELIKKPFQAKRKLLSGILNCADAAIEKTERLATEVKQYHTDKAERETAGVVSMETVSPMELAKVAEHEFQYGAEAFEAHQKGTEKAVANDKATKNVPVKSGKSR